MTNLLSISCFVLFWTFSTQSAQVDLSINIPRGEERQGRNHRLTEEHSCNNFFARAGAHGQHNYQILTFLNGLERECALWVAMYNINNREITDALNRAHHRGVRINVIVDREQWNLNIRNHSTYFMEEHAFPVLVCGKGSQGHNRPRRTIHSKFALAQCPRPQGNNNEYQVLLGSCNWTNGSIGSNFEYCVRIQNLSNQENGQPHPVVLTLLRQFSIIRRYKRIGDPNQASQPGLAEDRFCTLHQPMEPQRANPSPPLHPRRSPPRSQGKRAKIISSSELKKQTGEDPSLSASSKKVV